MEARKVYIKTDFDGWWAPRWPNRTARGRPARSRPDGKKAMSLSGVFQACECAAARMAALRDFGKAPSRCTRRKSFHGQPGAVEIRRNFESPESLAGTI